MSVLAGSMEGVATALYRRYRPEAFSEMIGQAHVTEPLMTALRTGRIGHAYLFSGPRGCGKTTSARILARCLNCAEGPTDTPCGVCPSCIELSREGGGSLDVVEIDAASHGGVDDARELRERAVFAPARDRYKIFIIDEAHMVTSGGFNALLKIVEEPPPHVKFIFATTEPEKVIGTIRSRTHHYPFRLIAPGALIDYVQQLCDSEGVEVEPGVLTLVVRSGGGSVRDTLSILDQLIAGSEEAAVSLARATGLLGFTSAELIDEVVEALGSGDSAGAFAATDRVVQTGQDPRRFVEDLLERLRDLIVVSATTVQGAAAVFRGVPEDQLQRMFEQSQRFAPAQLSRIADTVSATLDTMVGATAPRLHLELMVARALLSSGQPAQASAPVSASASPQQSRPAAAPAVAASPAAPVAQSAPQTHSARIEPPAAPLSAPSEAAPGPAPAVDVIAAMRSARDFLKSDSSGASRPPMVPLGGHPSTPPIAGESVAATGAVVENLETGNLAPASSSDPETPPADQEPVAAPGLDDLLEVWPDLLQELLETDRDAWNSVRQAHPLGLEGEILTIGLASKADLDAFKASGAGPLRDAIADALGFTVKYVPKPLPTGAAPLTAGRERAEPSPQEPSPPPEVEPEPVDSAPARDDSLSDPDYEPEPVPAPEVIPETEVIPEPAPENSMSAPVTVTVPVPEPEPVRKPSPEPAEEAPAVSTTSAAPGFVRYGEAVVREVLGARFLEEKPLPPGLDR